jgi:hypothetical protein
MTTLPNFTSRTVGSLLAVVCLSATSLTAQTIISADLQRPANGGILRTVGAAAVGTVGDTWNYLDYQSSTYNNLMVNMPLVTSTGSSSPVTVTFVSNSGGQAAQNGESNPANTKNYPNALSNLFVDYAFVTSGTHSFTFSNLNPSNTYSLYLFGAVRTGGIDYSGSWTIGGTTKTTAAVSSGNNPALTEGVQYVSFTGLTADINNQIVGTFNVTGGVGVWNGFQLVAIPEPSSFAALAGLGALGFAASRRRRR